MKAPRYWLVGLALAALCVGVGSKSISASHFTINGPATGSPGGNAQYSVADATTHCGARGMIFWSVTGGTLSRTTSFLSTGWPTWTYPAAPGRYTITATVDYDNDCIPPTSKSRTVRVGTIPPNAPDAPTLTPSSRQIAVAWGTPSDNGGATITDYDVHYRAGTSGAWTDHPHSGTTRTATITDLTNGQLYQVEVRANNSQGQGEWSDPAQATPLGVPSAPAEPTLVAGDEQIAVSWDPPDDNGGAIITGYDVHYRAGTSGAWIDHPHTSTARTATITNLSNGQLYQVEVRASNSAGSGNWSDPGHGTPQPAIVPKVPDAPEAPTLTPGSDSLTVAWVEPANGGDPISGYSVRYRSALGAEWTVVTLPATSTTTAAGGLTTGVSYEVQVRAENSIGAGPWSFGAVAMAQTPGSIVSIDLPAVVLLRTPLSMALQYAGTPTQMTTLEITGDDILDVSPDCEGASSLFSPPPTSLTIYPCATGVGSLTIRYGTDTAWVKAAQVIAPLHTYTVTVTSEDAALIEPTVLWRSSSWSLYRDGLVEADNIVVASELADRRLRPLYYFEPGEAVDAATVIVCPAQGSCTQDTSLWTDPPVIGDVAYFLSESPPALLQIAMQQDGRRDTPWVLEWEYGTASGWEPLAVFDGTEGLRKSGTVTWNQVSADRPMAPRTVAPLSNLRYAVRATVSNAGSGTHTQPVIASAGTQAGLWGAVLQQTLAANSATTLVVYVLRPDVTVAGDYRRAGPSTALVLDPPALSAQPGPWRPWQSPGAPTEPGGADVAPPVIGSPIPADGGGLPLIGFAVEHAAAAAVVPPLLLWTLIGMGVAFAAIVATQRATKNILVSVIAGGIVLAVLTSPSIGISALWVVMLYGLIGAAVVIIGKRLTV